MEQTQNNSIDPVVVIWSRKWAILLFTLVVTGTAIFASSFLSKQYEAKATVLISPPMFNVAKEESFFSIDSYTDLAVTSGILQGVIDRLAPKYPDIKKSLYPRALEGMISIETGVAKFKSGLSRSSLLTFKVRGQDPSLIKDIANTLANVLSEASKQMRANEIAAISRVTEALYTSTKDALGKLEKAFQEVRVNNQLESVVANQRIKQINLRKFETQLMKTNVELIGENSKLSSLTAQAKKYPDMVIGDLITNQVNSKALAAKQIFLSKSVAELKKEIPQLEGKVLQMELQEEQLERQVHVLKDSFMGLAQRVEEIRISESEKTSDMRLISQAIEPHFPVWPNKAKIALITLVFGLTLGIAIALSKEHLDNTTKARS